MKVERYPFDYDKLNKGDEISAEELAEIIGEPVGSPQYQFKLMALMNQVHEELLGRRGLFVTVAVVKGAMRILTDAEARPYLEKAFARKLRGLYRHHEAAKQIDQNNLNQMERELLQKDLLRHSRILQALDRTIGKDPDLFLPYRRETPGLLPGAENGDS